MNLSPELYEEFALKYDRELLDYFGGGIVHFCGRGDHYIDLLTSIESLTGINMSQPHLNDMDKIFDATVEKSKRILALKDDACEKYAARPNACHSMLYCGRKTSVETVEVKND
jgi:hypothetical protein